MKFKEGWPPRHLKDLPKSAWLNLTIFVILFYLLVYIGQPLLDGGWCLLNDYLGYYSAGQIMNTETPSAVYDFNMLEDYQTDLHRICGEDSPDTEVISMVYLPVFFLPFRILALLNFPISVIIWLILNLTLLILYLNFFTKKVFGEKLPFQAFALILISIPVFKNFITGQVNIWLLIGMGEFIRALVSDKPYRAGLWLGVILVKPQLLILILPFLLIQKQYKVLGGFAISSAIVIGFSLILVGWDGMIGFKDIIFESAQGGATSHYDLMMNWRAVGYYISKWVGPTAGASIEIGGSVLTAALPLIAFRKTMSVKSPKFGVALLAVLAATSVVTYHAHTHTAMILIPILLYLLLNGTMAQKIFNIWFLAPSVFNFIQFLVGAMVVLSVLPFGFAYFVNFSNGLVIFVLNLILLGWALSQRRMGEDALSPIIP